MSEGHFQAFAVVTSAQLDFLANGNDLITRLPDNPNSSPLTTQKMLAPGRMGVFLFQVATEGKGFRIGHMVSQRQLSSTDCEEVVQGDPVPLLSASCVALDKML